MGEAQAPSTRRCSAAGSDGRENPVGPIHERKGPGMGDRGQG